MLFFCLAASACSIPRIVVLSDPLTAQEHNDLGVAYELMGEADLALGEYESAFNKDRTWDQPLINHGNVHAGLENWELAEKSYLSALERNPDNPEAMNNLAYVLLRQGRDKQAVEWSARAVKLDPENPALLNTQARAVMQSGNHDQAQEIFQRALNKVSLDDPLYERIRLGLDESLEQMAGEAEE
ncbi:tetratricopeptide repeat protein [Desulfonatronovibrio hydrogenovorans]|uniref:tetratricopeptide repeat protein n=1 Tax=Desulfonatronovibrio hydrogenovorans TaxID=53245 RepID=UPI001FC9D2D4|nr:tetratricopeptide repeat protein [Desulfonatronovibrio hydrogenovorans]